MTNLTGQVIGGRYRIERVVAKGGMATVYLAHDERLERNVALKIIHPHLAGDANFREKFIREAKIAAKLSHPNLVNVFDQGEDGDLAFLAMEYVSGITLRDALKDFGVLDAKRALELFEPVVAGLAAAHRAGILHRDLKPENIFLADDGRIKLGDFGLARAINNHTSTGSLVGTVAYLSPELVVRGVADARSDVYAAGIILFEMLTGRQPYLGEQAVQIAYQHANENVPAPSTLNKDIAPLLDELVLWATAKNAADRPADATELLSAVQRARADIRAGKSGTHIQKTEIISTRKIDLDSTLKIDQAVFFDSNATAILSSENLIDGTQVLESFDFSDREVSGLEKLGKRNRPRALLLSSLLVILLGSGAGWWFGAGPGGLSAIPDLTSRTVAEAEQALSSLNAKILIAEESSATVSQGLVARTEPGSGAWFLGGTITIFVSTGAKLVTPPNLAGLDLASATAELIKNGFVLGAVNSYFNQAPIGQVFDYLGADGAKIPEASKIDLSISLGSIPAVLGMSQEDAVNAIEAVGLTIAQVSEDYSDAVPAGQVISVVPLTEPLGKAGSVNLIVSKGPNIVIMPEVVGETVLAGKAALEALGLNVVVNTNQLVSKWGIVTIKRQSTNSGVQLRVGDQVTISTN